jgi:hypothetical protein
MITQKCILLVVLALLGGVFVLGCQTESQQVPIVDVDDFASDPWAYDGDIAIRGIVSFVYSSDSVFVIIDVKEYELCGVLTCAINEISISVPPDEYSGELPNLKDEVLVYGKIKSGGDTVIIDVSSVEQGTKTILKRVNGEN